ncbi:uncharacterized protein N7496_008145 [Penicillium cataractarum]|uniref:Uncharacterized protein n=1 Tax=Penicillium cataractarum TaxID=2100454 RepID=A0A9W9RZ66_9EURO|nr:uncharacterized protein N7496_008145 [Penicillium cataractarum]KAJ5368385.1 hypothetical protein N7496_008145 [Penicillium cataractarum]
MPVKVKDYAGGHSYDTFMVAGFVGIEARPTPSPTDPAQVDFNSIQPYSAWWMYELSAEK